MTITLSRALRDTWAMFRRDWRVLLSVAAPFLFLPAFAVFLLVDAPPDIPATLGDEKAMNAWLAAFEAWGPGNVLWYVAQLLCGIYGTATIAILLVSRERPTVAQALRLAARRYPRFVLVALIGGLAIGLGLRLLVLPGLFVQARLIAAVPLLAADRSTSALAALTGSVARTKGATMPLAAAVVTLFLMQIVVAALMLPVDGWLRVAGHENPVVLSLVDALLVAATAAYQLGIVLLGVRVYRGSASSGI